jgi:DNA-binding NarL/FixJ family response regulator
MTEERTAAYYLFREVRVRTIRVLLADDHPVVRGGLKALVDAESDMEVVAEAADGVSATEPATKLRPDVVVMDLSMPKRGGAMATEEIVKTTPETKVLVLSVHQERGYVQQVLAAGASGYVLKHAAAEELVRAVRTVARGAMYLDPAVARHVVALAKPSRPGDGPRLSEREAEVLRMISRGHAMKEIASLLDVSTRTLETYKARGMEKLGLKSRADLVRYALHTGWLKDE